MYLVARAYIHYIQGLSKIAKWATLLSNRMSIVTFVSLGFISDDALDLATCLYCVQSSLHDLPAHNQQYHKIMCNETPDNCYPPILVYLGV